MPSNIEKKMKVYKKLPRKVYKARAKILKKKAKVLKIKKYCGSCSDIAAPISTKCEHYNLPYKDQ